MNSQHLDDFVRQLNPSPAAGQLLSSDTATVLARAVTGSPPHHVRSPRRLARLSVAGLVVTLGGVGTALAVQALQPAKDQIQVFCNFPDPDSSVLQPHDNIGATGDPIADCADLWLHETGSEAPALKAYQDTYSQIQVFAADQVVPSTWRPLPGGVLQDTEAILLNEALGDVIDGVGGRCFTKADATAKAQQIVDASGFANWSVKLDDAKAADGPPPYCWGVAAVPRDHLVHGVAISHLTFSPEVERLAEPLRKSLAECWSLPTAVDRVRAAIAQSGFPAEVQKGFEIRQIPTPGATCTRIYLNGGGNVILTLRGPAT